MRRIRIVESQALVNGGKGTGSQSFLEDVSCGNSDIVGIVVVVCHAAAHVCGCGGDGGCQ